MRRIDMVFVVAIVAIGALVITLGAGPVVRGAQYGPSVKYQAVSATDTSTNVDFGFRAAHLLLINDGANEAFVDFGGTVATNTDFELKAGESLNLFVSPMEDIGIICSAGETATVRVLAMSQ